MTHNKTQHSLDCSLSLSTEHAPQQLTVSSPSGGQVLPHSQSTNLLPAGVPPPSQPTNPSSVHVPDMQIYIDHELDALLNSLLDDET